MIESVGSGDFSNSLILAGENVHKIPDTLLQKYSEGISVTISEHPGTMIQYSPTEIYQSMIENRAVVAIDEVTKELLGFGQVWAYAKDVLEFGSWIAEPGIGKPILMGGSLVAYQLDPKAQVVAIVEESNIPPQASITKMGGVLIGSKTSERVFDPNSLQPAHMKIYDVSLERMVPHKPAISKVIDNHLDGVEMTPIEGRKEQKGLKRIWHQLLSPISRRLGI